MYPPPNNPNDPNPEDGVTVWVGSTIPYNAHDNEYNIPLLPMIAPQLWENRVPDVPAMLLYGKFPAATLTITEFPVLPTIVGLVAIPTIAEFSIF